MKKIWMLIISLIFLPLIAKADMGAPAFYSYEAMVTKTEGINSHNSDCEIEIPYGEVVIVDFETGDLANIGYKDNYCYVDVSYLTPKTTVDNASFLDGYEPTQVLFKGNAVTFYKGPSKQFGVEKENVVIPRGTILTIKGNETFAYVEYEDVSGWVYVCRRNPLCPYGMVEIPFYFKNDALGGRAILFDVPFKDLDGNVVATIPHRTIIDESYENYDDVNKYIRYNGTLGYVDTDLYYLDDYYEDSRSIILLKPIELYSGTSKVTVPKGTILPIIYTHNTSDWINDYEVSDDYYEYYVDNGKYYGWVKDVKTNNTFAILYKEEKMVSLDKDYQLYSDVTGTNLTDILVRYTDVNLKYYRFLDFKISYNLSKPEYKTDNMVYVESQNGSGWIKMTVDDPTLNNLISNYYKKEDKSVTEPQEGQKKIVKKMPARTVALYSVVSAVVGGLCTIVIIKLVNKKGEDNEKN